MSEKTTFTCCAESSGQVQIAGDVIASIARTAVLEAEGVAGMAGYFAGRLGRKKPSKGVTIKVTDGDVNITVEIVVKSGAKIQAVAKDVQQRVKNAIETMTGFAASEVNVLVSGLVA